MTKTKQNPEDFGFHATTGGIEPTTALSVAINGRTKRGKTRFLLSAPKPIAFFNLDRPIEPSLYTEAGLQDGDLYMKDIIVDPEATEDIWRGQWDEVYKAYMAVLKNPDIRSVCVDTGGKLYDLVRYAKFGRLSQVPPNMYGVVYAYLRPMANAARMYNTNIIWAHHMKKEYKGVKNAKGQNVDTWTGDYEAKGWKGVFEEVQVTAELYKDDDGYNLEIVESGIRAGKVEGEVLYNDNIDFAQLASFVTGTNIVDWL